MSVSKLDMMIKRAVEPGLSVQSVAMYLSACAKKSEDELSAILNAVCDEDISKAAHAVRLLPAIYRDKCEETVLNRLCLHCRESQEITVAELLTVLEYNLTDLFCESFEKLNGEVVSGAFSKSSSKNACRLMNMFVDYSQSELYGVCETEFCEFLNKYDASGDEALTVLLPRLIEKRIEPPISKLISVLGSGRLKKLYGDGWQETLTDLVLCGCQSVQIWEAYFAEFFIVSHTDEELLTDGLWFLQFNANEELEELSAAVFYLYVAKLYGVDCAVFEYANGFETPSEFSRKQTILYEELIRDLWQTPERLAHFIRKTELCNPFAKEVIRKDKRLLIKNSTTDSSEDYRLLEELFKNAVAPKDIITIFFNTFLKMRLTVEDVFYFGQKYGVYDELLTAFESITFNGKIEKFNKGVFVVSTKNYYATMQHTISCYYFELQYLMEISGKSEPQKLKGFEIEYTIIGYSNGMVRIRLLVPDKYRQGPTPEPQLWEEEIAKYSEVLGQEPVSKKAKRINDALINFPVEFFAEDYNLDLLTELVSERSNRLDIILPNIKTAKWNAIFRVNDISTPRRFYSDFEKYSPSAIKMFEKLFADGVEISDIFALYFETVYKVIVPFDKFILMTDKERMLQALSERIIFCKLLEDTQRHKCRLMNIKCAPLCVVSKANLLRDNSKIPVKCIDYNMYDNGLGKIIFEDTSNDALSVEARGELFGYIAQNVTINRVKIERISLLPDASVYDVRETVFNLTCMASAIDLRRGSGDDMIRLIRIFGAKNPYSFQRCRKADIVYMQKCFDAQNTKKTLNAVAQMILNTELVTDIAEIYLNSHFKYYIDVARLASRIADRRPDLTNDIPKMFRGWEFICAVDMSGYLISPFIPQSCARVSADYAGKCVACVLSVSANGDICAEVKSVLDDTEILTPVLLCEAMGYTLEGMLPLLKDTLGKFDSFQPRDIINMTEGVEARQHFTTNITKLLLNSAQNEGEYENQLSRATEEKQRLKDMIRVNELDIVELKNAVVDWFERNCHIIPLYQMQTMTAEITDLYVRRSNDGEEALRLLYELFFDYSNYFRSNDIVKLWYEQLDKYFDNTLAENFEIIVKKSQRYLQNRGIERKSYNGRISNANV